MGASRGGAAELAIWLRTPKRPGQVPDHQGPGRTFLVGDTGIEPVTSSVSSNPQGRSVCANRQLRGTLLSMDVRVGALPSGSVVTHMVTHLDRSAVEARATETVRPGSAAAVSAARDAVTLRERGRSRERAPVAALSLDCHGRWCWSGPPSDTVTPVTVRGYLDCHSSTLASAD